MRLRTELESGDRLEEALAVLTPAEPYLAYANFAAIAARGKALFDLHRAHLRANASRLGVLVVRDRAGQPLAMAGLGDREFESTHFGLRMARVDPPHAVADDQQRSEALRELYATALDLLQQRSYQHVCLAASTHDRVACWLAQDAGAHYVGTKISWMQSLHGEVATPPLPAGLQMEVLERPTSDSVARADWKRLLDWTATAFDRGPLVCDLSLPFDRAKAVYQVWTEKALTGEWADVLLLVRDRREVVAFHTMMLLPELSEAAGVGILGRGIGGTMPGYRGLFSALQRETAARRPLRASYLENETQASNIQSIQVFGKLGHQCIRSTASFHLRFAVGAGAGS